MLRINLAALLLSLCFLAPCAGEAFAADTMTLAVADFKAVNLSAVMIQGAAEFLRTRLANSKKFAVTPREKMERVLGNFPACADTACAVSMGKALNVKKVLSGSVSYEFGVYTADINVVDVSRGGPDVVIQKIVKTEEDIIRKLPELLSSAVTAYYSANPSQSVKADSAAEAKVKISEPELSRIPGGEFMMGDAAGEGDSDEVPVRKVFLDEFYMGKNEVTFEEYDRFCEITGRKKPDDAGWGRGRMPVINVTWNDAVTYCAWLSEKTGKKYRLPAEAEWEKAARGGLSGAKYPFAGIPASEKANYANMLARTAAVRSYPPAGYGLFDMSGNVWEWCSDWYDDGYYSSPSQYNPKGPQSGKYRVLRGGGWGSSALRLRCADRGQGNHDGLSRYIGFRVVREK